jgi:integrase
LGFRFKNSGQTLRASRNAMAAFFSSLFQFANRPVKDEKKSAKAAAAIPANDLIDAVTARFISQHAKRNLKAGTAKEVERLLQKEIVSLWLGRRLAQITRADIHAVLDSIVERGSPIQANRTLAAFRTMCRWAVERGLIDANPCTGIRAPSAETARDRVLSDDELKAVWQAAEALDQPYREFVQLLILTGQRRSEVAEMRWSEINLDAGLWTLPKERGKKIIASMKSRFPILLLGSCAPCRELQGQILSSRSTAVVPYAASI